MLHDRIANDGELEDILNLNGDQRRHFLDELIHCATHYIDKFCLTARIHHDVGHSAHEVLAVADLRVHLARTRDHLPARQVAKMCGHRCRAHVEGDAVSVFPEAWPHSNDAFFVADGDRQLSFAVGEFLLQIAEDNGLTFEVLEFPICLQGISQTLQVTDCLVK